MEKSIFEALEELYASDAYPFHMPGHKRNMENYPLERACQMDITEIDGFDNLHDPQGLILDSMNRAKRLYNTKETFFLVNGSTAGILTAVHACVKRRGKILISRNSHKSVYNAAALLGLEVVCLYPQQLEDWNLAAGLSVEEVKRGLEENPDAQAILVTSPTYDGFVSPIKEIADLAHKAGIPLIVDEAHGAHFPFSEKLPESALTQGADLVVQSLHKTMPALTQTALLHLQGNLVQLRAVKRYLSIFQSSSPSYLLMGGIDYCIRLVEEKKDELWTDILQQADRFFLKTRNLKHIQVWCGNRGNEELLSLQGGNKAQQLKDPLKLIIAPGAALKAGRPYTGVELYQELSDIWQLQMEMMAPTYVLGILTCMDRPSGLERLEKALLKIDSQLTGAGNSCQLQTEVEEICGQQDSWKNSQPEKRETIGEALEKEMELTLPDLAEGRECAAYINLYPPGIPLIVPGEVISRDIVDTLLTYSKQDLPLQGLIENKIPVVKDMVVGSGK